MANVITPIIIVGLCFASFLVLLSHQVNSEPIQDRQALLAFISHTDTANHLRWNTSASACTWVGVKCNANRSSVLSLRLQGLGLVGHIPANTIGSLTQLRVLSLGSNYLSGLIPTDFSNLNQLRSLYLQKNLFSGAVPPSIGKLSLLTLLDLSSNNFTGSIPYSVNNMTGLRGLLLENNGFSGTLPRLILPNLMDLNVSNNYLSGSIPNTFSSFPASAFAGNAGLCGAPLSSCSQFYPSAAPSP